MRGPLPVGVPAPGFAATDDAGNPWKSSDFVGKRILIVYFFPGDFTAASIRQARQFDEDLDELEERGVELVGVSGDSAATHQLFKRTHDLRFTLLADEAGEVARQFGVRVSSGGSVRGPEKQAIRRKVTLARRFFAIDLDGRVATSEPRIATLADIDIVFERLKQDFWRNREDKEPAWMPRHDRHWKRLLTRQQYLVTRKQHTERAFSGEYYNAKLHGSYRCVGCGQVVFESTSKFLSGTGWPSFSSPAAGQCITLAPDRSGGMTRTEVKCRRCDAHLGHVFLDGPPPTRLRFCINSAALVLEER